MKLLLLGGTLFLGKHIVEAAVDAGHEVTLFNRGKTRPSAFPEIEQIHGNRDGGLEVLAGRNWDAVIDTCGYVPRVVKQSAEALVGSVKHYTFISSISVYKSGVEGSVSEANPVGTIEDPTIEAVTGESYGPLKALCEQEVQRVYGDRGLIIRPGLIVGPDDISDRFTYWPSRMARGGEVLVPAREDQPIQIIDVRDLAVWIVDMVNRGVSGIYNACAPEKPFALRSLLETIRDQVNSTVQFVPVSSAFLEENGIGAWKDLPLYLGDDADEDAMMSAQLSRAIGEGLKFRPISETIADTLAWSHTRPSDHAWRAGISEEREMELLAAWKDRTSGRVIEGE